MKKISLLLIPILSVFAFWSCEEDDVCIEGTTPPLIVTLKKSDATVMDSLFVYRQEANGAFTTVNNGAPKDSLAIPLRLDESESTKVVFALRRNSPSLTDTVSFTYDYAIEYISKACGYKVIYNNISERQKTHHFIKNFKLLKNNITDETSAHIVLYY